MSTKTRATNDPISLGIKAVGVGRRGSKPLTPELIEDILTELKSGAPSAIARGAFFGALIIKGITPEEHKLADAFEPGTLDDLHKLTEALAGDAPDFVKAFCARLLRGETLNKHEAEQLGDFLFYFAEYPTLRSSNTKRSEVFERSRVEYSASKNEPSEFFKRYPAILLQGGSFSDQPGDGARGMAASILRVRYETADEYEGLLRSMHKTIEEPFRRPVPEGAPIVQLAEPFDGVDHSNLITPLTAQFIGRLNYRVVNFVGRNSGPKYGNNLLDLAKALRGRFMTGNEQLGDEPPPLGWYLNQQNLSTEIDRWVERRRQTIKRPFLSTLERFINPLKAHIMIASAFHPPYGEKMLTICERAGYPGGIIIRNGLEGTMAFSLMRPSKILCGAKQKDGSYLRHEITIEPESYLDKAVKLEERLTDPSLEKNAALIETYQKEGRTSYDLFDARIKITCAGFKKAIGWVEDNISLER